MNVSDVSVLVLTTFTSGAVCDRMRVLCEEHMSRPLGFPGAVRAEPLGLTCAGRKRCWPQKEAALHGSGWVSPSQRKERNKSSRILFFMFNFRGNHESVSLLRENCEKLTHYKGCLWYMWCYVVFIWFGVYYSADYCSSPHEAIYRWLPEEICILFFLPSFLSFSLFPTSFPICYLFKGL